MTETNFKNRIIAIAERFYTTHTLLLLRYYIKSAHARNGFSKLEITGVFAGHLLRNFLRTAWFALFKFANFLREKKPFRMLRKALLNNIPALKKHYYEIDYPLNIAPANQYLFFHRNFFLMPPLFLKSVKNSCLYLHTDFGVAHRKLGIIKNTIHGVYDKRNVDILKPYNKIIFKNYSEKAFEKGNQIIHLKPDKKYLLVHNWFNYYHWLTETLYRLISIGKNVNDYTLVLPETLQAEAFVTDSLQSFPGLSIQYFPNDSTLFFEKLYYVQQKKYCDIYEPHILAKLRMHFADYVKSLHIKSPVQNNKIFIARKEAKRSIVNEAEVFDLLENYGFSIVDFAQYSFYEQIAIAQQTQYMLGIHGAGLSNMLFMEHGSSVMALYRKIENPSIHHCLVYWRMAGVLNHKYYLHYFDALPNKEFVAHKHEYYYNTDFNNFKISVDLNAFENDLKKFISDD